MALMAQLKQWQNTKLTVAGVIGPLASTQIFCGPAATSSSQ